MFPDFLTVLHLLSRSPHVGRGQAEQWQCVQVEHVEPPPTGVQEPRGDEGALAAGVGVLRHVHLQRLQLPQSKLLSRPLKICFNSIMLACCLPQ